MKRQFESARKTLAEANLDSGATLAVRAWLEAREGNTASANLALEQLRIHCAKHNLPYCDTAMIDTELGRFDSAFASLETGLELRHWKILMLSVDPRLEPLHQDPSLAGTPCSDSSARLMPMASIYPS